MSEVPKRNRLRKRPVSSSADTNISSVESGDIEKAVVIEPVENLQPSYPEESEGLTAVQSPPSSVQQTNTNKSDINENTTAPVLSPRIESPRTSQQFETEVQEIPPRDSGVVASSPDNHRSSVQSENTREEKEKRRFGFKFQRRKEPENNTPADMPNTSENQQLIERPQLEDNRGVRPMPRYESYSMFDFLLRSSLSCGLGYTLGKFHRLGKLEDVHPGLSLNAEADGLSLGVNIRRLTTYREMLVGIVRPVVKIHLVSADTGFYIKSRNFPATAPVSTKPCPMVDVTTNPCWMQEIILNSYFSDAVADDALLLFEILDDKPTLRTNYKNVRNHIPIAKRVAWGYLLPIGTFGELNVGFSNDWGVSAREEYSSHKKEDKKKGKPREGETAATGDEAANAEDILEESSESVGAKSQASVGSSAKVPIKKKYEYPWRMPNVDKVARIQLHHYRQYDGIIGTIQRSIKGWPVLAKYSDNGESAYPNGIPEIYLQWRLQRRLRIDGAFLDVALGPRPAELMPILLHMSGGMNTAEPLSPSSPISDKGDHSDTVGATSISHPHYCRQGRVWNGLHGAPKSKAELGRLRTSLLKRTRGVREPCVIPDKLLYRVEVSGGSDGAMVVAFSHSGHVLAIASKSAASSASASIIPLSDGAGTKLFSIILFDTDLNEEVWVETAAHHAVIYDLKWSPDDKYLLSCSGDGTCKVWDMLPVAFRSSNTMGFGGIMSAQNENVKIDINSSVQALRFSTSVDGNIPMSVPEALQVASQKPPRVLHTLSCSPPVFTYCGVFQMWTSSGGGGGTFGSTAVASDAQRLMASPLPRIITGSADGRLRVWECEDMVGYIHVAHSEEKHSQNSDLIDYSPHEGHVHSLVIDERTRYLLSADGAGDILAWRMDGRGWYQLLRKFKRDAPISSAPGAATAMTGGVMTLCMHPDKHRGQLLVHSRDPAQMRMVNLSTYKTSVVCNGYSGYSDMFGGNLPSLGSGDSSRSVSGGMFHRSCLSADGRYIIAGCSVTSSVGSTGGGGASGAARREGGVGLYRLQVWDASTGHVVRTPLSDMTFPYPIRSVAWHPQQHLLAVAMVGYNAAVSIYCGDRESAEKSLQKLSADQVQQQRMLQQQIQQSSSTNSLADLGTGLTQPTVRFSQESTSGYRSQEFAIAAPRTQQVNASTSDDAKILQAERTRELLERIRQSKKSNTAKQ